MVFSNGYRYVPKVYKDYWRFEFFIPFVDLNIGDQYGIDYERRIYKNWRIGIGYFTWNKTTGTFAGSYGFIEQQPTVAGSTIGRSKFQMKDLYVGYKYNHFKRHKINIDFGCSYTWGISTVIDSVYWNPDPPYDGIIYRSDRRISYWGIIGKVSYDYLLLHNRVGIGANVEWRKYFDIYSSQIIYGVHTTVNF